jgi:Isocitrate/isopropylmalate dehydrogenase
MTMQGDIISDLCAGLIGGLGLTPSANVGVYDPDHSLQPSRPRHWHIDMMPTLAIATSAAGVAARTSAPTACAVCRCWRAGADGGSARHSARHCGQGPGQPHRHSAVRYGMLRCCSTCFIHTTSALLAPCPWCTMLTAPP